MLGIVRGHSGAIKCYTELGRGTTFKALFPAVETPVDQPTAQPVARQDWPDGATVLVVDDDETVRAVARRILEKYGCQVITASDGREGIDIFREKTDEIDVVLLDMTMPHVGGEAAYRELRRIAGDVRVILSSGYNEEEAIDRFAGKGLAGFVQKPYGPAELIPVLSRVLRQHAPMPEIIVAQEQTSAAEPLARRGSETILLVDDDPTVRDSVRMVVEKAGYSVIEAENGRVALEIYEHDAKRIDLVLLDQSMPGLSGDQTLARLREIDSDVKVILFSGSTTMPSRWYTRHDDDAPTLSKPYTGEQFWRTVRQVLDSPSN